MALVLTADEQRLLDWALEALPEWFAHPERPLEELKAAAKVMARVQRVAYHWFDQTYIGRATIAGPVSYLDALAQDLGTKQRAGEDLEAFRQRLRSVAPAVIPSAILEAAQAYVDARGIAGAVVMIDPLRDLRAFMQAAGSTTHYMRTPTDGGAWRMARERPGAYVLILPLGATEVDLAAVTALARAKTAGGFRVIVERATA